MKGMGVLTDVVVLISVRNGAGQVQQQDIGSTVVEEELGTLQQRSYCHTVRL